MGMVEGAAILLAGILIGRFLPERRRKQRAPDSVRPVCGCQHQYAFHDPESGQCSAQVEVHQWNRGRWAGMAREQCPCRRYTGPEPLPEYFAPEIERAR